MTMQVGMVGSDGILLAGDTQWTDNNFPTRAPWNETKLRINHKCGVAVLCAGKLVAAGRLADEIIGHSLKSETWLMSEGGWKQSIEEKVIPYVSEDFEPVECLVAFTRPTRQLRHFQIARFGNGVNDRGLVASEEITTKRFAGDIKNPAKFWAERYYPRRPQRLIKELVPLAAHLVCVAHSLNTAGISGLEIALCDESGIHCLTDEEIERLETQCVEWDRNFGEVLLGASQQFGNAPNVVG